MMAIHSVIEEIIPEGELSKDWNADIHIIASNVYVKTPQGWRMVLHHASIAAGDFPVQINMDRLH